VRITVVNGYHDSNKGSCAIAWGLFRRLERTGMVDSLSLVSMLREDSPLYESGFRHLRKRFTKVDFYGSPVTGWTDYMERHKRQGPSFLLQWFWSLMMMRQVLALNSPSAVKNMLSQEPALKAIQHSDLIVERGGPFFAASRNPINPSLYFYAWPLLFAKRNNIPFGFAPESVGPVSNPFARNFVKDLFKDALFITVRENISRTTLMECGVEEQRIRTMLDSAFWVEPQATPRLSEILGKYGLRQNEFLVVVCRQWKDREQWRYHRELAAAIDLLVPRAFPKVALVLNAYGPMGGPDDSQAARQLFEMVKRKEKTVLVEEDLAPDELAALYGQARLVIGTRLHSVILSLTGGTPVLAVSYGGPKTRGIMQLIGLEKYVIDMNKADCDTVVELAGSAMDGQEAVLKQIPLLRQRDDQMLRSLLENAEGRGKRKGKKSNHGL
jgi:colanic acid/amylovoran biosynthesis protein